MKTKLLFVLVHFMFASNAQTKEKATAEAPEVLNIKFQKFPIADFPENVFPVSEIRLIQNVKDSINLGYALKGLTDDPRLHGRHLWCDGGAAGPAGA